MDSTISLQAFLYPSIPMGSSGFPPNEGVVECRGKHPLKEMIGVRDIGLLLYIEWQDSVDPIPR